MTQAPPAAQVDAPDSEGLSPLARATYRGHAAAAAEVRAWGASVGTPPVVALAPPRVPRPREARRTPLAPDAFWIDDAVSPAHLEALDALFDALPTSGKCKDHNSRRNVFDVHGWAVSAVADAIDASAGAGAPPSYVFPQLRFLDYRDNGGLAPHVDLARTRTPDLLKSTHTFCLYLTSSDGGETVLVNAHNDPTPLAVCPPKRGRLFVFKHVAPHMANPTRGPKRLLRGDCCAPTPPTPPPPPPLLAAPRAA